jgi:hypothetical protein
MKAESSAMDPADLVRLTNRGMIAFHLALGTGASAAPEATLRRMGHDAPWQDARRLFHRCGPIWLTFAVAHLVAAGCAALAVRRRRRP